MTKELSAKYDQSCVKHKQTNKQTDKTNNCKRFFFWVLAGDSMSGKNLTIINRIISDRHTYTQCCGVLLKTRPFLTDQFRMIKIQT